MATEYQFPGLGTRSGAVLADRRERVIDALCRCDCDGLEAIFDELLFGQIRTASGAGSQDQSSGTGDGLLVFDCQGSGSQDKATSDGVGSVSAAPVPVPAKGETVITVGGGSSRIVVAAPRPWSISRRPKKRKPIEEPQVVIIAGGSGAQAKQSGSGAGGMSVGARGWGRQGWARARGGANIRYVGNGTGGVYESREAALRRRHEEEQIVLLLLDAA